MGREIRSPIPRRKRKSEASDRLDPTAKLVFLQHLPEGWDVPEPESPRGRIMSAARQLFAERGLEETSVRDITQMASVNSAMVHYYFHNKEALYHRVIGLEILSVFQTIEKQLQTETSSGELLMGLSGRIMRVVRANPIWAKLFQREMAMGASHLEKVVRELKESGPLGVMMQAKELYRSAVRRGELRDLPMDNVIQFLLVLGYCGVFYEPLFRIMTGHDPNEDKVFEQRSKSFENLIRHGLIPLDKSEKR